MAVGVFRRLPCRLRHHQDNTRSAEALYFPHVFYVQDDEERRRSQEQPPDTATATSHTGQTVFLLYFLMRGGGGHSTPFSLVRFAASHSAVLCLALTLLAMSGFFAVCDDSPQERLRTVYFAVMKERDTFFKGVRVS